MLATDVQARQLVVLRLCAGIEVRPCGCGEEGEGGDVSSSLGERR